MQRTSYVGMRFHRRVWYRALSLRYACIRSSGIILIPYATFLPNFVSFATSVAELAHGEKLRTQSLTQPTPCSLFDDR